MTEPVEIFVLGKTVRLLQPAGGFRTSLDSVMLAAACPAKAGERILDLGCGVGGASFCLLKRIESCSITGIEKQPEYIDLAKQNAILNGRPDSHFVETDIRTYKIADPDQRFDGVICNPPYMEGGQHMPSPDEGRATALGHQDEDITLKDWIDCAFHALKSGGHLTMIHRADALDRIIQFLGKRFGAIEIIPLWPRTGEAAKRLILRARKDRHTPAKLHPGLVLHEADGRYTEAADAVLRAGAGLEI